MTPTEEAVTGYRALAADNPAHLPNLAMALTNLGACYGEVGRRAEALAPTEEAVTGYRALAADNPDLALGNLGVRYSEVGRRAEAVTPTEGGQPRPTGAGRGQPRPPTRPRGGADQPRRPLQRGGPAGRGDGPHRGGRHHLPGRRPPTTPPTHPTSRRR